MCKGPAGDVGEDLLHDGVVAVLLFGLDQRERGVGEDGVVPPDGKQLILPGGRFLIEVAAGPRPDPTPAPQENRRSRAEALSTSSLPNLACGQVRRLLRLRRADYPFGTGAEAWVWLASLWSASLW